MKLTEAEVKQGITEYLGWQKNLGKLWFTRLNAGDIYIPNKDGSYRVFKGAGAGAFDFIVIQPGEVQMVYIPQQEVKHSYPVAFVTFIECKSTKGELSKEQLEFLEKIRLFNCRGYVVRSVEDLIEVLKRE